MRNLSEESQNKAGTCVAVEWPSPGCQTMKITARAHVQILKLAPIIVSVANQALNLALIINITQHARRAGQRLVDR